MKDIDETIKNGYEELACQIVAQAVIDCAMGDRIKSNKVVRKKDVKQAESFLHSEWCHFLCGLDNDAIDKLVERKRKDIENNEAGQHNRRRTQGVHKRIN